MDYWSRITLAAIMGVACGIGVGFLFGDYILWVVIFLAIALASETSLRTIKNVGPPQNEVLEKLPKSQNLNENSVRFKPPKPKF